MIDMYVAKAKLNYHFPLSQRYDEVDEVNQPLFLVSKEKKTFLALSQDSTINRFFVALCGWNFHRPHYEQVY